MRNTVHPVLARHRPPVVCAEALNAPAIEIDLMSMADRLLFLRVMCEGAAARFGASASWGTVEQAMELFRDGGLGASGTWFSWVNAGVLEAIERGLAIALNPMAGACGNPGAVAWAAYLNRRRGRDRAWAAALQVSVDYGVFLAEEVYGLTP